MYLCVRVHPGCQQRAWQCPGHSRPDQGHRKQGSGNRWGAILCVMSNKRLWLYASQVHVVSGLHQLTSRLCAMRLCLWSMHPPFVNVFMSSRSSLLLIVFAGWKDLLWFFVCAAADSIPLALTSNQQPLTRMPSQLNIASINFCPECLITLYCLPSCARPCQARRQGCLCPCCWWC